MLQTTALSIEERTFLRRARAKFEQNTDWLAFEDFAFGSRSPLFTKTRSHQDILQHPLYLALREMWLELGVRQGKVKDAARGKARGRR